MLRSWLKGDMRSLKGNGLKELGSVAEARQRGVKGHYFVHLSMIRHKIFSICEGTFPVNMRRSPDVGI